MRQLFYIKLECGEKLKQRPTDELWTHHPMSGLQYISKAMDRDQFLEIKVKVEELIKKAMNEHL